MRVQNVNPKQKIPEAGKRDNILAVLFTCFGDERMLFLSLQVFLVLRRSNAIRLLEILGEVARIVEAHLVGYLADVILIGVEQMLGILDSLGTKILRRRDAHERNHALI